MAALGRSSAGIRRPTQTYVRLLQFGVGSSAQSGKLARARIGVDAMKRGARFLGSRFLRCLKRARHVTVFTVDHLDGGAPAGLGQKAGRVDQSETTERARNIEHSVVVGVGID